MKKQQFLIIDGHALLHRAWHAIPPLTTKQGEMVNAVYGFTSILIKILAMLKPTCVVATFDRPGPTFRHEEFKEYKATRVKKPDELYHQIVRIQEVVAAMGIPIFERDGFEADDIIATLRDAAHAADPEYEVVVLTGDLDALQLVDENTKVYSLKKGVSEFSVYDIAAVKERYDGLTPSQIIDYKALRGDVSDNIPGVRGVGEKTAIELIKEFDSIEALYAFLKTASDDQLKDRHISLRIAGILRDQETSARQSLRLATMIHDVPIDFNIHTCRFERVDYSTLSNLFQVLEFKSLLPRLADIADKGTQTTLAFTQDHKKHYILANTNKKIDELLALLQQSTCFALDTETTSLETIDASLIGMSFCQEEGRAWYVPHASMDMQRIAALKTILESPEHEKVGHNIKYDYEVLQGIGITLQGISFDTMLAAYLLNADSRGYSLDALSFSELGIEKIPIDSLIGKGKQQISMADVPIETLSTYACEDADMTWRLYHHLVPQMKEAGQAQQVFDTIEVPLIPVLAAIEMAGCKLDTALTKKLSLQNAEERTRLAREIYEMVGEEFNIDSPLQLKRVLFEVLQISPSRIRKGKTGLSTAASELEKMRGAHPVIEKILGYREVTKLGNTYLDVLPGLVNETTGRIHTKFNQTVAATGRLSSSNPNLQNIPIKTELGRQLRKCFVAETGYTLLAADYSQIELRIVASLSGDEKMIEAFRQGYDIHTATAAEMNGVSLEEVTKDMRRAAKAINFGILYGMGPQGVAESASIPYVKAKEFIDLYFETYTGVREFLNTTIVLARELGYVETLYGRRRYVPDINSSTMFMRSAAERVATNMPIQGTSADIIKLAMIALHARLGREYTKEVRMILQVHDELVFEVKNEKLTEIAGVIKEEMESAAKLKVPIIAEINTGPSWGDMSRLMDHL